MTDTKKEFPKMFKDKVLLITGGTGSFGNAVLKRFLDSELKEIRIFSRDEKKQEDMRIKYNNEKIKFYIGDVRDYRSIEDAMDGVDYVFHAAALKQVPSCEFFPIQAVETNVLGANNVIEVAINHGVKKVIVLSTDKAAYPINAMGMTKALMEKVAVSKGRDLKEGQTIICRTRYGNVMASRGSVIPLFCDQIAEGKPLTITNPEMTRFMMTLDDAVDLVIYAFEHGEQGDLFVQKAPAATIQVLAEAIKELKHSDIPIKYIGSRHGEKLFEVLVTKEEMIYAEDLGEYYKIPADNRNLNYAKYENKGDKKLVEAEEYNSHNTKRLDIEGMKELLKKLDLFN
jgi:UDP-glucose 4-epimerase